MVRVELAVEGETKMHCSACENRVRFALSDLEGVHNVEADAKSQRIAVVFDNTKIAVSDVKERLNLAGFQTVILSE